MRLFISRSSIFCLLFLFLLSCKTGLETKPGDDLDRDQYLEWFKEAKS